MRRLLVRSLLEAFYVLGFCHMILCCERWLGRRRHVIVLTYHHLREPGDTEPGLSRAAEGTNVEAFERHIEFMRRWYAPISVNELEQVLDGGRPLFRDAFLVSFDDGYRDNRKLAGPVLRRHDVPAVVFVPTGMIESKSKFWWLRLDDVVKALPADAWGAATEALGPASLGHGVRRPEAIRDFPQRRAARAWLNGILRKLAAQQRESLLDRLASFGPAASVQDMSLLTWEEMRQMQREGFSFGGHTHTHPDISLLSADEIAEELRRCGEILQEQLGRAPRAFAYPFGAYRADGVRVVSESNFRLAFTTQPGQIVPGKCGRYELPRLGLWRRGRGETAATIVALKCFKYVPRLAAPLLAWLLGEPAGRIVNSTAEPPGEPAIAGRQGGRTTPAPERSLRNVC